MRTQSAPFQFFSKRTILCTLCIGAILPAALAAKSQDETKKGPIQVSMRSKLEATSKVLEGLALEDKELIHEGAEALTAISKAEVWQVLRDTEYREHTQSFRNAIRRLDEAAQKSEFASAQLEWLSANKSCFDCHNHIRAVRK